MRSLIGSIRNLAPRYAGSGRLQIPWRNPSGAEAQMAAMGSVGTLFVIVNRLSTAVAKAEWKLYRKAAPGSEDEREEVHVHPALDLWNQPNKHYSRRRFVETVQQHIDLTGEGWWVTSQNERARQLPLELWPVRPDRMAPVPSAVDYVAGYIYTDPDGREVPYKTDEVTSILMPNPLDPYRGLGPVQTILTDLDSARYTSEWNRNFFRNDATPGGVLELPGHLDDTEWDEFQDRWAETHKGIANAHRIAILEHGAVFKQIAFSMRDMQFAELRTVSRDVIMEAFGIHKAMLGISEDVNRSNAKTGEYTFAKWLVDDRLDRWRGALNGYLLPRYADGKNLEFDYASPVPEDEEAENAERESKANAAATLINAGLDHEDVLTWAELPPMRMRALPAAPAALPPGQPRTTARLTRRVQAVATRVPRRALIAPRNAEDWPAEDPETVEETDLTPVQEAWETALAALLAVWAVDVIADWIDQLVSAVRAMLRRGEVDLSRLQIDTTAAEEILAEEMVTLASTAAEQVADEAAAQGVTLTPTEPAATALEDTARLMTALDAERLALSAGAETARVSSPDAEPDEVAERVREHLESLSDAGSKLVLGAALTSAQRAGRIETLASGPVGAVYASEVLDRNTCGPCREIHGRFICTTDDLAPLFKLYPTAGYIDCEGGLRCRGTFAGVWRAQSTGGGR
jgi:HK97 family phage portal protein